MLAHDRRGTGTPLVLLHGTNSSRALWDGLLSSLADGDVISLDLPAHGASAPTSMTPPDWARDVAGTLDALGVRAPAIVGHSAGGWTALELARLGVAGAVLALAPAGLWRRRSPPGTDAGLVVNWTLGRLSGPLAPAAMRNRALRAVALRSVAVHGASVPAETAAAMARTAAASRHFPRHFARTRRLRFEGGAAIAPDVPVQMVWGADDGVARARTSRFTEGRLPPHAVVETWPDCGHMVMWDQPDRLVARSAASPVPDPPATMRGHAREALLEAAQTCLVDHGYAGTSARRVAAASGANLRSIAYHYGSLDELLLTALSTNFRTWMAPLIASLVPHGDLGDERDARARLDRGLARFADELPSRSGLVSAWLEAVALSHRDPRLRERLAANQERFTAALAGTLADAGDARPREHAAALVTACDGLMVRYACAAGDAGRRARRGPRGGARPAHGRPDGLHAGCPVRETVASHGSHTGHRRRERLAGVASSPVATCSR
jgi:pimeloyl-ACP methyl ester carboxylesterase/AcrR family transcriptional regulator